MDNHLAWKASQVGTHAIVLTHLEDAKVKSLTDDEDLTRLRQVNLYSVL